MNAIKNFLMYLSKKNFEKCAKELQHHILRKIQDIDFQTKNLHTFSCYCASAARNTIPTMATDIPELMRNW